MAGPLTAQQGLLSLQMAPGSCPPWDRALSWSSPDGRGWGTVLSFQEADGCPRLRPTQGTFASEPFPLLLSPWQKAPQRGRGCLVGRISCGPDVLMGPRKEPERRTVPVLPADLLPPLGISSEGLRKSELQPLICSFLSSRGWGVSQSPGPPPNSPLSRGYRCSQRCPWDRVRGTTGRKDGPPSKAGQGLCPFSGPGCGFAPLQQQGGGLKWAVQNTRAPGRPGWGPAAGEEGSMRWSSSAPTQPCGWHPLQRSSVYPHLWHRGVN